MAKYKILKYFLLPHDFKDKALCYNIVVDKIGLVKSA